MPDPRGQPPRPDKRRALQFSCGDYNDCGTVSAANGPAAANSFLLGLATAFAIALLLQHPSRVSCVMSNSVDDWERNNIVVCNGIPGLTKEQRELCHKNPDVTGAAIKGLEMAIAECQHQFMWHRWNCSSLTTSSITQHSSVILQRGYRETGFVYAIAAAGIAHAVSRACSMGRLLSCSCDPSSYSNTRIPKTGGTGSGTQWKWGGCSHNLEFGMDFSRQFLDAREVAGDIQSTVNLHNSQAGRQAVANNMQVRCKCHGMSGSCELKTCWRVVPDFRQVGRTLKSRFRNAVAVAQSNFGNVTPLGRLRNSGNSAGSGNSRASRRAERKQHRNGQQEPLKQQRNPHKRRSGQNSKRSSRPNSSLTSPGELVRSGNRGRRGRQRKAARSLQGQLFFFQKSPNFCERDAQADIAGTAGRRCNRPSAGGDGCASLCCGRGYNVVRQRRIERCACKFHWCCEVRCQNCTVEEWITVCK